MSMVRGLILCAGGVMLASASHADTFEWSWNRGDPGSYGLNDVAGRFLSIDASFNNVTNELSWRLTFDDTKTEGLTLVLSDGPNPKGHAGELAILYVDADNLNNLRMTAYAYNGQNSRNSFQDGNGSVSGNQTPDLIHSTLDTSWIKNFTVTDTGGDRTFDFTIDASTINAHAPLYPDNNDPWFGIGWAEKLGLWLHTYKGLDARYDQSGRLTRWDRYKEGWFDGSNFDTVVAIPMPAAATMGLAGLGIFAGRRRR